MTHEVKEADLPYLRRCVELATEAVEAGDFPFGSVLVGGRRRLGGEGSHESEWVDLPPDCVLDPGRIAHARNVVSYIAFISSANSGAGPSF